MVIGIDLGGMSAKGALLSDGKLLGKTRIGTSAERSAEETARDLARLAEETAARAGYNLADAEAIGIGAPGVVDSATGTVVKWSNFGWENVPLAALVREKTGKDVFVANDANAAALGESRYGAGKGYADSVLVTIGTGIGGGIILGGKLFEGYRSAGAEIGHMTIRLGGKKCTCGRRGCYECYASTRALIRLTVSRMRKFPQSALWKYAPSEERADGTTVFSALAEGDPAAKLVFAEFIAALGDGIVNLANLLRPQAILLGGGVSAEGETLLAPLREYVYPRLYVSEKYAPLDLLCAALGNDAGLYGAAQYAADKQKG